MQASVLSPPFLDYRYRVIDVVDARPKFLDGRAGPTLDDAN
ncbi:hypothetical protein QZM35_23745 [Burkholderia sp. AU45274]|nr:hypothetical protein [Burkholderia sp. AU45274]MDN7490731.1 hypothetical protein [Burkholderia sp. AU45274]